MPVSKALEAFEKEKLNCAQSILRGFQSSHRVPEQTIQEFKQFGGGKAEGGRCGALHAALDLLGQKNSLNHISQSFQQAAGSENCREIRKLKQLTCKECVELAAQLVQAETASNGNG